MRVTLTSRIALVVTVVTGLGVGLTVLLNYFKLAQAQRAVVETRLAFAAHDLHTRIESGLDLGLDLAAMANVQAILASEAEGDPGIVAVTVFDAAGRVLYSTGPQASATGGMAPVAWVAAARRAADWRADAPDALVVGSRLTSDFGTDAGGVALVYSRTAMGRLLAQVLRVLIPVALVLLLAAVLLARLAAIALFRRTERRLHRTRETVAAVLTGAGPEAGPETGPETGTTAGTAPAAGLEPELAGLGRSLRHAKAELEIAAAGLAGLAGRA